MFATLFIGTFISEDLTCIAAGVLAAHGVTSITTAVLGCAFGIWIGDLGLWALGRIAGARISSWRAVRRRIPAAAVERVSSWFDDHLPATILASRFAPGTRLPLYLAAGASRTSFSRFLMWTGVAAALWAPMLVIASALVGAELVGRLAATRLAILSGVGATLLMWRLASQMGSLRRRQRLAAAISRIWRWEFWPMWLFYAPVAAWTAWLAARHGGYRTITAANPGMPDGGVVGESKYAILSRLPDEWTIPTGVLSPGDAGRRVEALREMMERRGWNFPLVLKPDVGQRGTGVRLARSEGDARAYFLHMSGTVLLQPYHPGPYEAGIFYYRRPDAARGRILAITDKHFPFVIGDGRSTIEELVWADARRRMQAHTFLERLGARRTLVPAPDERVVLGIAGNHAQGTLFTDGGHLMTTALETAVDRIARRYDGFFIGRFDVRYRDVEDFKAGRDLAIVELNGATAECTNIYDPSRSLLSAYRALFLQWRLVFEIGEANRRVGQPAASTERLLRLIREHLQSVAPLRISD